MIERSLAPAIAALVACPARKLCPAYLAASSPARIASFFTTRATSIPDNRPAWKRRNVECAYPGTMCLSLFQHVYGRCAALSRSASEYTQIDEHATETQAGGEFPARNKQKLIAPSTNPPSATVHTGFTRCQPRGRRRIPPSGEK
jgi:hypothetical protein